MQTRHVCVSSGATVRERVWVWACAGVRDFQLTLSVCVFWFEAGAGSGYKENSQLSINFYKVLFEYLLNYYLILKCYIRVSKLFKVFEHKKISLNLFLSSELHVTSDFFYH